MASCVRNIRTKNYQNLIIGFKVTVKNVGDVFLRHSVYIRGYFELSLNSKASILHPLQVAMHATLIYSTHLTSGVVR